MAQTPFLELALLGERLQKTKKRLELSALIADFLKRLEPREVGPGLRLLIGRVFPEGDSRTLNLSWRAVSKILHRMTHSSQKDEEAIWAQAVDTGEMVRLLLEKGRSQPPLPPPLSLLEVYRTFEAVAQTAGPGSRGEKEELLASLISRAKPIEAKYIVKNVIKEMRHGVSEGIALDAIALASGVSKATVQKANMLSGDLAEVATIALSRGENGLLAITPRLFRPLKPMLAQMADDVSEAYQEHRGKIALEYKLDGARVQIHKSDKEVCIYSRNLAEVTESLPEVVEEVRAAVPATTAILEGEVIAIDSHGRPLPFQHLMRRFGRLHSIEEVKREVPVELCLFDVLYRDGKSLVDMSNKHRWEILAAVKGPLKAVARLVPQTVEAGEAFAQRAYEEGHEGVMAKSLRSAYSPGVRGKAWLKIKRTISLDLVIVAADWGYGRRHGWLSNYHLAARDKKTGEYLIVGKTFKGLTDVEFDRMTKRLLLIETSRRGGTIFVQPRIVVEVLFNELQRSPHYRSRLALRFARISRIREDKDPEEADTIQTMEEIFRAQFKDRGMVKWAK